MKKLLLFLCFFNVFIIVSFSQEVLLNVHESIIITPVITQNSNTLISSISIGNQWYKDGIKIEGATNQTLEISSSGNYMVITSNDNGCSVNSALFYSVLTKIEQSPDAIFNYKIFPNPNNGYFTIELGSGLNAPLKIVILAVDGKKIAEYNIDDIHGNFLIPIGLLNLDKGLYFVTIFSGEHNITHKLTIM